MTQPQWIEQAAKEIERHYMMGSTLGGIEEIITRHCQQAVAAERERCAKILKARASHLRTPEGCISAQWHSNDAFMVAGELERQAEAIRQMKDTNDDR